MPSALQRAATLALTIIPATLCRAAGPFDTNGAPVTRVVVTWTAEPPREPHDSPMVNRLAGIGAVLDPVQTRALAVPSRRAQQVGWPAETEVLGYAHVARDNETQAFRVGVTPDRLALFAALPEGPVFAMDADACAALLAPLRRYAGPLEPDPDAPRGEIVALAAPLEASTILLDETTIRDRLNAGRRTELPSTERYLPDERMFTRLPAGYTPRRPAGLLVWVDADPGGRPPEAFCPAADAMNLVMIGAADSGNARLATDRYQLALDAVATASRRFHTDPDRVYVAGISGGGRICSALAVCFPDIFTGAVPIVGLNCYEHVPLGDGRFVPLGFRKPDGKRWKLLRDRRIGAVSGPLDFNHREMTNAVRIYQRDGLPARLFEYEDMAHTLPTAERFSEVIAWVDAPVAEARAKAAEDAGGQLETYLARFDELPATTDVQRRLLERITTTAPWSDPAWRACELLGVAPAPPRPTTGTP